MLKILQARLQQYVNGELPGQTKQGSRPSRPDQEGRKGSEEGVPENLRVHWLNWRAPITDDNDILVY